MGDVHRLSHRHGGETQQQGENAQRPQKLEGFCGRSSGGRMPPVSCSLSSEKSYSPSSAHWALTVAPSCSTSWLTSLIREGLFLIVATPSGVRVVSMM